jgi:hypothetical protein
MNTHLKQYRWPLVVSLLILALSSAPILAGYAAQTPSQRFVGIFSDRMDYAVHMAMMHYGAQGGWDYQFRFTTEPQTVTYLKTIYVILGHFAGWTGFPLDIFFQVARLVFGLLACLSIYYLMTRIFTTKSQIRLAFILAILGAGLGWIQMPFGLIPDPNISPIDFWLIDAYVFFNMATLPHLSIVIAAMAFTVALFLNHLQRPRWLNIALIAVCAIFVQFVNPIAFIIVDAALAGVVAFSCWQKRRLDWTLVLSLGFLAIIQIPLMGYSFTLMTRDPAWAEFNRQNITLSPPPIYLLFGFGLFWPFALFGTIKALRQQNPNLGWAIAWTVFAIGMAYLPIAIQRRFLLAITIPLAVLATPAILEFSGWLHRRSPLSELTGATVIVALTIISSLSMIGASSMDMFQRPATSFEPAALVQAVDWLGQHGTPNDVVLAAEPTAQLIAIRTPLRLYFGHPMETLHYDDKEREVENFYRGLQPESWLENLPVTWVMFGPHEREWSSSPPDSPRLKLAYQNDLVTIYRVISP